MAIVTTGTGLSAAVPASGRRQTAVIYGLVNFLRGAPGWTVDGSSNGISGGMGLTVWSSVEDADSDNSWVALGSPDASLQILISRVGSGISTSWRVLYNPNADFSGGGPALEPSASTVHFIRNYNVWSGDNTNPRLHISSNDEAPYSFFMVAHDPGDFLTEACFLFWSTEGGYPGVDPHLFFVDSSSVIDNELSEPSDVFPHTVGIHLDGTPRTFPFCMYSDTSSDILPKGIPATASGDPVIPVLVARRTPPAMYHGISKELVWCAVARNNGDTLATGNFLVWDDVLIPWILPAPTVS